MSYFNNREFNISANLHKHQTAMTEIINATKVCDRNRNAWESVEKIKSVIKEYKLKWLQT